LYPPNRPDPMTITSNGSPPLPDTSPQVLHTQRPNMSCENAVCWTSTRKPGSGLRRGSIDDSFGCLIGNQVFAASSIRIVAVGETFNEVIGMCVIFCHSRLRSLHPFEKL